MTMSHFNMKEKKDTTIFGGTLMCAEKDSRKDSFDNLSSRLRRGDVPQCREKNYAGFIEGVGGESQRQAGQSRAGSWVLQKGAPRNMVVDCAREKSILESVSLGGGG